jgi:hypothetical protein
MPSLNGAVSVFPWAFSAPPIGHKMFSTTSYFASTTSASFYTEWSKYIAMINLVLTGPKENGFAISAHKCKWGIKETDWLNHWLTPTGPTPWH